MKRRDASDYIASIKYKATGGSRCCCPVPTDTAFAVATESGLSIPITCTPTPILSKQMNITTAPVQLSVVANVNCSANIDDVQFYTYVEVSRIADISKSSDADSVYISEVENFVLADTIVSNVKTISSQFSRSFAPQTVIGIDSLPMNNNGSYLVTYYLQCMGCDDSELESTTVSVEDSCLNTPSSYIKSSAARSAETPSSKSSAARSAESPCSKSSAARSAETPCSKSSAARSAETPCSKSSAATSCSKSSAARSAETPCSKSSASTPSTCSSYIEPLLTIHHSNMLLICK